MSTLRKGALVEICPYRAGVPGKVTRDYASYDGCSGPVVHLEGHGESLKAHVNVVSTNKSLAGGISVPVKALKPLEVKHE